MPARRVRAATLNTTLAWVWESRHPCAARTGFDLGPKIARLLDGGTAKGRLCHENAQTEVEVLLAWRFAYLSLFPVDVGASLCTVTSKTGLDSWGGHCYLGLHSAMWSRHSLPSGRVSRRLGHHRFRMASSRQSMGYIKGHRVHGMACIGKHGSTMASRVRKTHEAA